MKLYNKVPIGRIPEREIDMMMINLLEEEDVTFDTVVVMYSCTRQWKWLTGNVFAVVSVILGVVAAVSVYVVHANSAFIFLRYAWRMQSLIPVFAAFSVVGLISFLTSYIFRIKKDESIGDAVLLDADNKLHMLSLRHKGGKGKDRYFPVIEMHMVVPMADVRKVECVDGRVRISIAGRALSLKVDNPHRTARYLSDLVG